MKKTLCIRVWIQLYERILEIGKNIDGFDSLVFQVIHGLLDRAMQLVQVPLSRENGYHIKAIDGKDI